MLTSTDVDNAANTFTAVNSPTASSGGFGTFTMTAAGVWAYTIDQANSAVQALNVGDTLTDTFTVTTIDGTAQVVTIIINGADDAFHFKDKTSDLITSDAIDLAEDIPGSISFPKNDAGASGPPATSVEVQTIEMSAQWSDTSVWNQPGNEVTTRAPHDLIV
jgi:VCBS repeat-containing protein